MKSPLDPFEIEDGWFEIELVGYQVIPGAAAKDPLRATIVTTIEELGLNGAALRAAREEYAESYLKGEITLAYLRRHAPFVARELQRQGRLQVNDR